MRAPRAGYKLSLDAYKRSGCLNLRYKTFVYWEWESRLEIRVA
jgi:hypothetical protein